MLVLLGYVLLAGCVPEDPFKDPFKAEREATICADRFFQVGGMGYNTALCPRADQRMEIHHDGDKTVALCRCQGRTP